MRFDPPRPGRAVIGILLAGLALSAAGAGVFFWRQRAGLEDGTGRTVTLRVEAQGSDRAWNFFYVGADGNPGNSDDPASPRELRLPENAEVVIQLRSKDFIYGFSCPELNLKEIAVPDLEFSIAFRTGGCGSYSLAMDAMCGFPAAPGETMGILRIVSERDFQSWLASCFPRSR